MDARPSVLTSAVALLTLATTPALGAQDPAAAQGPAAARAPAATQTPTETPAEAAATSTFTPEQLEQIVAPIALHPDSLLSMILMASTYPLEIVEAARWVQKNASLKGKQLEDALKNQDWDPSVKSICGFPTVLKQMNDNLDWTQDLGDAFLGQKKELMDTVQTMRRKALEAGTLKTTEQQKVTEEDKVIVIETTSTEVIYVPTYSPTVVYGSSWYYPTYYYPPMYAPYPPGAPLFAFGVGVAWGAAIWGDCDWHGGDVDIDIDHHNEFNRNTDRNPDKSKLDKSAGTKQSFKHDPAHRKGANYKSPQTAQKYGAAAGTNRVTKEQARGRDGAAAKGGNRAATTPSAGNLGKNSSGGRGSAAGQRPAQTPSRPPQTPSAKPRSMGSTGSGSSALSGSRSPGLDRSASTRGSASRGSGGARSGGGRRSGGGGRRR